MVPEPSGTLFEGLGALMSPTGGKMPGGCSRMQEKKQRGKKKEFSWDTGMVPAGAHGLARLQAAPCPWALVPSRISLCAG